MFVTVFYGIFDFKTGELNYSNGGHNPPYILSSTGELHKVELTGGLPLGVVEGFLFKNNVIQLKPGDIIFTFTDGVTEAMDPDSELYSEEKLESFLKEKYLLSNTALVQETFVDVHNYAKGALQSDDITVMAVKFNEV